MRSMKLALFVVVRWICDQLVIIITRDNTDSRECAIRLSVRTQLSRKHNPDNIWSGLAADVIGKDDFEGPGNGDTTCAEDLDVDEDDAHQPIIAARTRREALCAWLRHGAVGVGRAAVLSKRGMAADGVALPILSLQKRVRASSKKGAGRARPCHGRLVSWVVEPRTWAFHAFDAVRAAAGGNELAMTIWICSDLLNALRQGVKAVKMRRCCWICADDQPEGLMACCRNMTPVRIKCIRKGAAERAADKRATKENEERQRERWTVTIEFVSVVSVPASGGRSPIGFNY
ncbi:uncharacterized protein BDR25DRAFT_339261 [Lindgomyces ingoldianus]|uniref:Uncharacterized protein n=1 Tax=Lindgomyces ingoldianus TaxID=673940 RepID=A0ACB6RDX8_9PLEO|nr:uncharacterized protein BDR25DRAFT_339261 [Lindgomyces ingoldianus]KAF2477317.1 hypothetical protein BDR25DRAFT_339261 [Lindgomyces ingoldianus]